VALHHRNGLLGVLGERSGSEAEKMGEVARAQERSVQRGQGGREQGSMRERNELTCRGKLHGSEAGRHWYGRGECCAPCGHRRGGREQVEMPETCGRDTRSGKEQASMVVHMDSRRS
jgi:hypothetical protein